MLNRPAPLGALLVLALAFAGCGVVDNLVGTPKLAVRRFVADPDSAGAGAAVTLSWDVEGAETIEIDNGVGSVKLRGNLEVRPTASTRYTLVARNGSEQATAMVTVSVVSPGPSPTPQPAPTPTPTPQATPTPSPTPGSLKCPASITSARACALSLALTRPLGEGQCLSLDEAELSLSCPAAFAATRGVFLVLDARGFGKLTWRQGARSGNYTLPSSGAVETKGQIELQDVLLGDQTVLEILDGTSTVATVTIGSR